MREHLNLTQKRLAEEAGVGAQTILRAEHNKPINAESRRLLCDYFGMTPEALGLVSNEQKAVGNRRPPDTPAIALPEIPTSPIAQAIAQGIVLASKQLESADMAHTRFHVLQRYGLAPHLT
jgi:transcriptional regulator with XRE-family HTH domain